MNDLINGREIENTGTDGSGSAAGSTAEHRLALALGETRIQLAERGQYATSTAVRCRIKSMTLKLSTQYT